MPGLVKLVLLAVPVPVPVPLPAPAPDPALPVDCPERASESVSWSWARVAWSWSRVWVSDCVSSWARVWPALTLSPAWTPTDPTVPDIGKATVASTVGSMVATPLSAASTFWVEATAVRYPVPDESNAPLRSATTRARITSTTPPSARIERRRLGGSLTVATGSRSGNSVASRALIVEVVSLMESLAS